MNVVEEGVYFLYDKDELVYIGTSDAPVYKIKGYFRLDKDWYKLHAKEIWNYVE